MMRPLERQSAPSDPRFSQSQVPVWNFHHNSQPAVHLALGSHHRNFMPSLDSAPIQGAALTTADMDFRTRETQEADGLLVDNEDGEMQYDEMGDDNLSDEDADADADADADDQGFAEFGSNGLLLRSLAASDHADFDFGSMLGQDSSKDISGEHKQPDGETKAPRRLRGPRKAAEPTADIMLRISRANGLFVSKQLQRAKDECLEIIRINAEFHPAYETLAAIFDEIGKPDFAATCFFYAAHFTPKITANWIRCINYSLDIEGYLRPKALKLAEVACSAMVRSIPDDLEARMKKAEVHIENEKFKRAINEYVGILKRDRMNRAALRKLAQVCEQTGEYEVGIREWMNSLEDFKNPNIDPEEGLGWEDLSAYIALYEISGQYKVAITELRSLTRQIFERGEETFWDNIIDDDREWDLDDRRRSQVAVYISGKHPQYTYCLPFEFRARLGLCRLHLGQHAEAMAHLKILHGPAEDDADVAKYSYWYRQVGDALFATGHHEIALGFYRPLEQLPVEVCPSLLVQIGRCLLKGLDDSTAGDYFKAAIKLDDRNVDARMELARMYERIKQPGAAFNYVTEIFQLKNNVRKESTHQTLTLEPSGKKVGLKSGIAPRPPKVAKERAPRVAQSRSRVYKDDIIQTAEYLQVQYQRLKSEHEAMKSGNVKSSRLWMSAAKALTEDFRSFKTFYPWDKYVRFVGYSGNEKLLAETSLENDLKAMAERLSKDMGADSCKKPTLLSDEIPEDYRGIPFRTWLDIFLDYALCLARSGQTKASYDICEAARDSIVFYHCREDMFLIQLCWCMCALTASDEDSCVSVVRFFMKDYQFTTDSYRMFAAMSRACHSPVSWYNSGPSQKFVLRQIKLMDFSLLPDHKRQKHYADKGSYSTYDANGAPIANTDMDIALLMLYGQILFTGGSYTYALNYFFRAFALDPLNPMINLNIGLAYIHHALKRQTENRQYSITQGLSFMLSYYESRRYAPRVQERQEAHYNMGRVYHLLGLVHLATPCYERVFDELSSSAQQESYERLELDTAYNLQAIYAMSGNTDLANEVTKQWLVI